MNLIRSEFFFFTSKGYLQIAGGILFLFKFMKKGNLSSIKPSQLRNLPRVTTFSDTIYFSSIFSRFPPFLPSFLVLIIFQYFLISSKQIRFIFIFPQQRVYKDSQRSRYGIISRGISVPFVFHRANETRNKKIGIQNRKISKDFYNKNITIKISKQMNVTTTELKNIQFEGAKIQRIIFLYLENNEYLF